MPLRALVLVVGLASWLALAVVSQATDIPVTYVVEATSLRKVLPATPFTFELYADSGCTELIDSETVAAGDIKGMEVIRTTQLKGAKRTQRVRLQEKFTGVASTTGSEALYLKVVSSGLVPIDEECQMQVGSLAASSPCPPDAVKVGNVCVDKYEASVWKVPTSNSPLLHRIRQGTVTLTDLQAAGATQVGCLGAPYGHAAFPANFPDNGNWTAIGATSPPTPGVYAVSIPGVLPTGCITQLRALQACALAGKRLIRNDEWQMASAGTPDPGLLDDGSTTCATGFSGLALTGARSSCVSSWGVHDMVGNVWEWTGDWTDQNDVSCTDWTTGAGVGGSDVACFGGPGSPTQQHIPGVIIRGGHWYDGAGSGVFAIHSDFQPNDSGDVGVRCVR